MGGKGGGGGSIKGPAQTEEGQRYLEMYPDVAASGLQPDYHYLTYGQGEGRVWGSSDDGGGGGGGFEMPTFEMPEAPDYEAIRKEQQAEADKKAAESKIDSMYKAKFAAANSAIDKVNTQVAEEMGYAKVSGADYSFTEEQKKERVNNVFASLWSEQDDRTLSDMEKTWGSGTNKWDLDIVRGVEGEGVIPEESPVLPPAGEAVKSKAVFGLEEDDDEDKLGGVENVLGG